MTPAVRPRAEAKVLRSPVRPHATATKAPKPQSAPPADCAKAWTMRSAAAVLVRVAGVT